MENVNQNQENMNFAASIIDKAVYDMGLLMQFASSAGVPADMLSKYSVTALECSSTKTGFTLSYEDYDVKRGEQNEDTIVLTFNKMKQSVTIARNSETKYGFETIGYDSMTSYERYIRHVDQNVTEFKVNGDYLDVTTASIAQTVKEDTIGGGSWIITSFNSVSDFEDENHLKFVADGVRPTINKQTYKLPICYKLQDGLESVISSNKSLIK